MVSDVISLVTTARIRATPVWLQALRNPLNTFDQKDWNLSEETRVLDDFEWKVII